MMKRAIVLSILVAFCAITTVSAQIKTTSRVGASTNANDPSSIILKKGVEAGLGAIHAESPKPRPTAGAGGWFLRYEKGWVYYNPATKQAYAVYGDIMKKWGEMGYETGSLGFPISDEMDYSGEAGYTRQSQFDKGVLIWGASKGVKQAAPLRVIAGNQGPIAKIPSSFNASNFLKKIGTAELTIVKRTDKDSRFFKNEVTRKTADKENGDVVCRTEYRKVTAENMNQDILNPEAIQSLRLGGVYTLENLSKGNFKQADGTREPMAVTITNKPDVITVQSPDNISLNSALEKLRSTPFAASPSGFGQYLESQMVNSEDIFNLSVGISYTGAGMKASNEFSFDKTSKSNKFILTYVNPVYVVKAEPTQTGRFFTNDAQNQDPSMVYIDKITYGVRLMVYFESELTEEEIKNNFKGSGWGVTGSVNAKMQEKLSSTKFKVLLYGSREPIFTVEGYKEMLTKTNQLLNNIVKGNKKHPQELGEPISYSLRFLDGSVAATSCKTTEIPSQVCGFNPNKPLKLNIALASFTQGRQPVYGWMDVEFLDKNGVSKGIQTAFDVNKKALVTSYQGQQPFSEVSFDNISKEDRDGGKLRFWFWIQEKEDRYLHLINGTQQPYTTRPGHQGNHYYMDIPLSKVLPFAAQPTTQEFTLKEQLGTFITPKFELRFQ